MQVIRADIVRCDGEIREKSLIFFLCSNMDQKEKYIHESAPNNYTILNK
ncbi:hypothetical protein S101446_03123 [Komagataeibacter europaeus]|nr:hypothetical protein S101446_03123 [Komagataeibacter europaeus]